MTDPRGVDAPDDGPGPGWIRWARPPVPAAFRARMEGRKGIDGEERPSPEALLRAAEVALVRSREAEDAPRDGAFDLLAADALLTWAAEAALEDEDPLHALDELVRRVAEAGRGPDVPGEW